MSLDPKKNSLPKKGMTQEEIVAGFNKLRQEQRSLGGQVMEIEGDINEHGYVCHAIIFTRD
jgi:hypothetical protein